MEEVNRSERVKAGETATCVQTGRDEDVQSLATSSKEATILAATPNAEIMALLFNELRMKMKNIPIPQIKLFVHRLGIKDVNYYQVTCYPGNCLTIASDDVCLIKIEQMWTHGDKYFIGYQNYYDHDDKSGETNILISFEEDGTISCKFTGNKLNKEFEANLRKVLVETAQLVAPDRKVQIQIDCVEQCRK